RAAPAPPAAARGRTPGRARCPVPRSPSSTARPPLRRGRDGRSGGADEVVGRRRDRGRRSPGRPVDRRRHRAANRPPTLAFAGTAFAGAPRGASFVAAEESWLGAPRVDGRESSGRPQAARVVAAPALAGGTL